jgi:bifunctional non-homologous end joining protein LigD
VCALDESGVPRFHLLQPRINLTRGADTARLDAEQPVVFFVFDLLYLDGNDLRGVPLRERKKLLDSRLVTGDRVRQLSYIEQYGKDVAVGAKELGFEGVVGKKADSRYEAGQRSRTWLKVKSVMEQEFVVGGYTAGEGGRRSTFGALSIGYYEGDRLIYAGNVGSGFNDKELAALLQRLKALEADASPFAGPAEGKPRWVRPELVVQVKFAEWTQDGRLRAPVFEGLRNDVEPRSVGREDPEDEAAILEQSETASDEEASPVRTDGSAKVSSASTTDGFGFSESTLAQLENPKQNFNVEVEGHSIKLTNLDKVFWPPYGDYVALTKRDMISFYVKLAPYLLPHLTDRPLTLTRYPNGVTARPFYQKHYEQPLPEYVETVPIWSESNKDRGDYILCNNLPTLVWLAQIADLELHAWMSRIEPEPDSKGRGTDFASSENSLEQSALNYPDFMVFDLDPYIYSGREGKGDEPEYNKRGWEKTVEIALHLKDLLDQLRLSSFVKTSGKTGLHIYVPVVRNYDYDAIRAATQTLGRFLIQQHPRDVTMEWDTTRRRGKVFFDANQNTRGKTLAAQYSLRPTPWAGVSTPLAWSELPQIDPTAFNIRTLPERMSQRGDVWADILAHKSDLSALLAD